MEDLNSQIAKLTADYTRQQELNTIRTQLAEDKYHSNYNNKIQELRGFNPLSVQPNPQEHLMKRISAPVESFMSTRNTRFETENRVEGDAMGKQEQINEIQRQKALNTYYNSQSPLLRSMYHQQPVQQYQQPTQEHINEPQRQQAPDNYKTINEFHHQQALNNCYNARWSDLKNEYMKKHFAQQHPQQNNRPAQYTREDMNAKMDTFRFDNSTFQRGSLVPVNMDHYYSGNLFSEGNPVPEDLRNEYSPGQRSHPNSRVHYQEKSKTMYKDEFNERLSALSPLSRTLFYPVAEQQPGMQPPSTLQPIHNINNRRQELNDRMSQHMPLSSAMALPAEYSDPTKLGTGIPQQTSMSSPNIMPGQPKKVAYNTIYPVSSK